MQPLAQIRTVVENTLEQIWVNRGCVRSSTAFVTILWDITFLIYRSHIYTYIEIVKVTEKPTEDAMSQQTNLSDRLLLQHLNLILSPNNPFRLLPLPSEFRRQMTSKLHSKRSHKVFLTHSTGKTQQFETYGSGLDTHTPIPMWHWKTDPFPTDIFQAFMHWYLGSRRVEGEGGVIKKRYVEQYIQSIGNKFSYMGFNDPIKTSW